MSIFCYQHHIVDWRSATGHLTMEERGVYRELMDAYYVAEGNLTSDVTRLYRVLGIQTKSEKAALATIIKEFFEEKSGILFQKRCSEELQRITDKSEKARQSVNAKHLKNNNTASTNVERPYVRNEYERSTNNEQLTINNTSLDKSNSVVTSPPEKRDGLSEPAIKKINSENWQQIPRKAVVSLAEDWELPEEWGEDAERLGYAFELIVREAEKFKQYWRTGKGEGKRKSVRGWRTAFSNWMANTEKYS